MTLHPRDLDSSLLTRPSLLGRIRNWQDSSSWSEFYRRYFNIVYNQCRRHGLNHVEAEEVAQDVFRSVAESISNFSPQPKCGSFRRWLLNLTRWRVIDFRRQPDVLALSIRARLSDFDKSEMSLIEAVADPALVEEEAQKLDWRCILLESALARLAQTVPAKRFQVFDLYARRHWPPSRIARELGISQAVVYLICHRLTRKLKKEVTRVTHRAG